MKTTVYIMGADPNLPVREFFKVRGTKFDPIILNKNK